MIFYAMVVRNRDGLILSATSDTDGLQEVKSTKRVLKSLAKKIVKFPDRCTLNINPQVIIHFITTLGVSYVVLCETSYPNVLAFSFLDELMKEFTILYNTSSINKVSRPYAFIDFDHNIQKLRHRYNNPRYLTTKVNLSDLSSEIKLRPPHSISVEEVVPLTNGSYQSLPYTVVSQNRRLVPVTWLGIIAMFLSGLCALFNFIHAMSALNNSEWQNDDASSPLYGFLFLIEGCLQCTQIYLLLQHIQRRYIVNIGCFAAICICNMSVWNVRDLWQILIHVAIDAAITFSIIMRRIEQKAANYNV